MVAGHVAQLDQRPSRGELAAATVVGLVERQPPRRPRLAARVELVLCARGEGARPDISITAAAGWWEDGQGTFA
jgi:hypothetical protein